MFLSLIGLAFRGSIRENFRSINLNVDQNYFRRENEGNFIGMVQLLAGENADLAAHIKKCQGETANGRTRTGQLTYLSTRFINSTLYFIRKYIVNGIVREIKRNGGRFGLLMDGSQDITSQEQTSVVARYVDDTKKIVEHTILFMNASNTSGTALYKLLNDKLTAIGLSMSDIVGYSFDGAPNMRSENIGLSAYIKEQNEHAIYTWCLSHRFNLINKIATKSSQQIKNILTLAEDTAKLFRGSYVKMNVWNEVIQKTPNISSKIKLKLIGTTRWCSKQDAVSNIISAETHLFVVIKSLLKVCGLRNLEREALVNAISISNSWLDYENIVFIFVLHEIFSLTVPTTKFLQKYAIDLPAAIESVKTSKKKLENARNMLNIYIQKAGQFIEKTNVLLSNDEEIVAMNGDCCIHLPTNDEKQNIHMRITNNFREFIAISLDEIDGRILREFDDQESIFKEIINLDPRNAAVAFANDEIDLSLEKLCARNDIANELTAIDELRVFTSDYMQYQNRPQFEAIFKSNDLINSASDLENYDDELMLFLYEDESDIKDTMANIQNVDFKPLNKISCYCFECMIRYISAVFANIYKIFKYVAMLPSTQVKCERDFSKMKLIKNRLRSSMTEKSLENVMIISTQSEIFKNLDLDLIVNELIASSSKMMIDVGF